LPWGVTLPWFEALFSRKLGADTLPGITPAKVANLQPLLTACTTAAANAGSRQSDAATQRKQRDAAVGSITDRRMTVHQPRQRRHPGRIFPALEPAVARLKKQNHQAAFGNGGRFFYLECGDVSPLCPTRHVASKESADISAQSKNPARGFSRDGGQYSGFVAADVSPLLIPAGEKFEPTHVGCYDEIDERPACRAFTFRQAQTSRRRLPWRTGMGGISMPIMVR